MRITIAGTGYVGLVTGVALAEIGHEVICYDIDDEKVNRLKEGISPIYEPGIEQLLVKNQLNNRLSFSSDCSEAYSTPDIIMIAVGTPEREDGSANLSYVYQVAKDISKYLKTQQAIVVTKSTVPVGTNRKVKQWIEEEIDFHSQIHIVSNPEFLREGSALYDTFHGDRIVIGSEDEEAATKMEELYSRLNIPIIHTDIESAEMIKYASNAFLATKISFINEIANICEKVGANIEDVSKGIGMDQRIGSKFLQAGIGYGGSCFPKDTKALVQLAGDVKHRFHLLEAVINVNNNQPLLLLKKARNYVGSFKDVKVAVLGLAFKPNTDDIRESAAFVVLKHLLNEGAQVNVYDPIAIANARKALGNTVSYYETIEAAIKGTELVFIVTEWKQVKEFPLRNYLDLMKTPIVIDGRNCYDVKEAAALNMTYSSIGRESVTALKMEISE